MLTTCKYCRKIHDKKKKCGAVRNYYREKNSRYKKSVEYNKIIKSRKWQKVSELVKSLDCNSCLVCKHSGLISPSYLEVHHINKVVEDYEKAFEIDNLISLCIFHHKQAEAEQISKQELFELIKLYRKDDYNNVITVL